MLSPNGIVMEQMWAESPKSSIIPTRPAFKGLHFRPVHRPYQSGQQMGCSISPILFVVAFEIILIRARQVVGGVKLQSGQKLPPLWSYMCAEDCSIYIQTWWHKVSRGAGQCGKCVVNRTVTWSDVWKISQARIRFLIRSTYNTLPCPWNLHQWYGTETAYKLCSNTNASLQHILSGCKTVLTQGRYRWMHDQVCRKLARQEVNRACPPQAYKQITFVRQGMEAERNIKRSPPKFLTPDMEWSMEVDLGKQLHIPREISSMSLRPDVLLWSREAKTVLTIPKEDGVEAAHERKWLKYSELATECNPIIYPVE
ncbi:unnamed protein product, partial [Coregonus sp. 'balchen']